MFKIGDKVYTTVFSLGKQQKMSLGIIVAVHSGYYDVDIMSIHGGAPWIVKEQYPVLADD